MAHLFQGPNGPNGGIHGGLRRNKEGKNSPPSWSLDPDAYHRAPRRNTAAEEVHPSNRTKRVRTQLKARVKGFEEIQSSRKKSEATKPGSLQRH